jgi:hypothetical protein
MDGIWTCHVNAKQITDVKGVQITKLNRPIVEYTDKSKTKQNSLDDWKIFQ